MTKHIEYKNQGELHIAQVIANKGICWQVQDDEGNTFMVQKKHVTRGPWEETEEETAAEEARFQELKDQATGHSLLGAALAQATAKPAPKAKAKKEKAEPAERDPNLVTLKELCFQLDVIPRIARRKLRKALGNIGTGSRWEWTKDSEELAKVRQALTGTLPDEDPESLSAEDQEALNEAE